MTQGLQGSPLVEQSLLGLADGYLFKFYLVACLQLAQQPEVGRDDIGNLGIAAGGLTVAQHDDGLALRGNLDGAEGDAVGDNVAVGDVLDDRAIQTAAHAVKVVGHMIGLAQEGFDAFGGEGVVLGTENDPQDPLVSGGSFCVRVKLQGSGTALRQRMKLILERKLLYTMRKKNYTYSLEYRYFRYFLPKYGGDTGRKPY